MKMSQTTKNKNLPFSVKYSFFFVSLVSPTYWSDEDLLELSSKPANYRRAFFKKSYVLATWLNYLYNANPKNQPRSVAISVFPINRRRFTLTKAPMAHKTRSKEQFEFKFYFFKITFTTIVKKTRIGSSVNNTLWLLLTSKHYFPIFETNLLFLKYYNIQIDSNLGHFLKLK